MKKVLILIIITISYLTQAQVGVGQWRDHLNYTSIIGVVEKDNKIITATSSGLFIVDKESNELSRYTTLNGLTEIDITSIAYDEIRRAVLIGYSSGNIDVILDDEIKNIPELLNTLNIEGSKTINNIVIEGDFALLSCNFGLLRFDLKKMEIADTYRIGLNNSNKEIYQSTVFQDTIFAATKDGIFYAPKNHLLLNHFSTWKQFHFQNEIPDSSHINFLVSNSEMLLFNRRIPVYNSEKQLYYKDGVVDSLASSTIFQLSSITESNDNIIITRSNFSQLYKTPTETNVIIYDNSLELFSVYKDKNDVYWLADINQGLINLSTSVRYLPSGPSSSSVSEISYQNDIIYIAHGGKTDAFGFNFSSESVSYLENNQWKYTKQSDQYKETDIMAIAVNPSDPSESYLATWGSTGLIERKDHVAINAYTEDNSEIEPRDFGVGQYLLTDVDYDNKGNLWVLSSQSKAALTSKDPAGNWKSYSFGSFLPNVTHTNQLSILNSLNQKWILTSGQGIIVLDESQAGSKYKKLTTSIGSGNLIASAVTCAKMDHSGKVWIGTSEGLSVMSSPRNIFNGGNYDANHVLVFFDGNWEPIFNGQFIKDIEIDGGNRKWFATLQGAYLTSEDGTEQIYHFTKENSPLISNDVRDIAINKKTGEVFFATDKGVVSFRSDAQELEENERKVIAFPNPVTPNYSGLISIDGLIPNSTVKIADVSGRLVYQTQANGNRAVWDGNSLQGERVSSGVYIVYSSDSEGEVTEVTKISIVR